MKTITSQKQFITRSARFDYNTRAKNWASKTSTQELRAKAEAWQKKEYGFGISDASWEAYCRLHELRWIGVEIQIEEEEHRDSFDESLHNMYDVVWDEFNSSDDAGMAYSVQQSVLKVDLWA